MFSMCVLPRVPVGLIHCYPDCRSNAHAFLRAGARDRRFREASAYAVQRQHLLPERHPMGRCEGKLHRVELKALIALWGKRAFRGRHAIANTVANRGANRGANCGANCGPNRGANRGANCGPNRGANCGANHVCTAGSTLHL